MKAPTIIVAVALICGATLAATYVMFADSRETTESSPETEDRLLALEETLARLDDKLDQALADTSASAPELRISQTDIEAAVAAAVQDSMENAERAAAESSTDTEDAAPPIDQTTGQVDLAAFLSKVRLNGAKGGPYDDTWQRVIAAGQIDDAIDVFEEQAELDPGNAELQVGLGDAYISKLFTVTNDMEKGQWAMKADSAYSDALALDDHHWNARFNKAISLSFWPPIMGKQPEAIGNFETLIQQQESAGGASDSSYAQTYLFLGNLYKQSGKIDKAQEIWKQGLVYFPTSQELKGSLN